MREVENIELGVTEKEAVKYNATFLRNLTDRKARAEAGEIEINPAEKASIDDSIKLLDHGWPARDIPLLKLLEEYRAELGPNATEGFLTAYNSIMNDTIITVDDREDKLKQLEDAIAKTDSNAYIMDMLKVAQNRTVFDQEVGKDKAFDETVKYYYPAFTTAIGTYATNGMTGAESKEFLKTELYDDITLMTGNDDEYLIDRVYGSPDPDSRKVTMGITSAVRVQSIEDEDAFNEYKKKVRQAVELIDKKIEKNFPGMDEQSKEVREFVRNISSKPARRLLEGYSNQALEQRTPFGLATAGLYTQFFTEAGTDNLKKKMAKWGDKYPVFGLVNDAEDQLQTFSDYYTERDKTGGSLTPEKEQIYRQKIYDNVLSMQAKMTKMKKAWEDPDTRASLNADRMHQDPVFDLHPAAQRGLKELDSSIESYKVGLENGWALDDIALLSSFHLMLYSKESIAKYGVVRNEEDFVEKNPPEYRSEAEKEHILKMRALYDEIKNTKLTSAVQRNQFIDRMDQLVDEGIEKGFFIGSDSGRTPLTPMKYYVQHRDRLYDRNLKIAMGKEPSFHIEDVVLVSEASRDKKELPEFENRLALTKESRDMIFRGQNGQIKTVEELSPEELQKAAALYDRLFDPIFEREAVSAYLQANPDKNVMDFFKLGEIPFSTYIGTERMQQIRAMEDGEARLKAEIVRLATDSMSPLAITTVRQDPATKEFKVTTPHEIIDVTDKTRAIQEKPYLKNIDIFAEYYKKTTGRDTKNYTVDDWSDLYYLELRRTFNSELIKPENQEEKANLEARANSDLPSSLSLEYVKSIFGANPKFVNEFVGNEKGEGRVYTADQFKTFLKPVASGKFTNDEFGILGYIVSTVPEVIDGDVYPEAGNGLPKEDKVRLQCEKWTTALKDGNQDIGEYMGSAIKDTRNNLSSMISEYEAGTNRRLPQTIAKGISNLLGLIKDAKDVTKIDGKFAFCNHILNETIELLDKYPDLKVDVSSQLSPEEIKLIGALGVIHEHQVNRAAALARLEELRVNNIEIEDPERDAIIEEIGQFDFVIQKWSETTTEARSNPDFRRPFIAIFEEGQDLNFDGMTAQQKLAAQEANTVKLRRLSDGLKLDGAALDSIQNDDVRSANAPKAGQQIREIRAFFEKYYEGFLEAKKITDRQSRGKYQDDITPEISAKAQRDLNYNEYHVNNMRKVILLRLEKSNIESIYARFNKIAKEKGWKELEVTEHLGGNQITIDKNVERAKAFANCIIDELEVNPYLLEKIGNLADTINNMKTPDELSLKENVNYPANEDITKLKGKTQDQAELDMLDKIDERLAERKAEVNDYIDQAYSPDKANAIVENMGVRSTDQYAGGHFGKQEEMYEEKTVGTTGLEYSLIKNPDLVADLKNTPATMSEADKAQVLAIINKIRESGFVDKDSQIEQGTKIYIHDKLVKSKKALKNSLKTGDMAKIKEAYVKYEEDHKKMEEIFEMTRNAYGDSIYAPGNVSTLRNKDVPPEFNMDILTESRVNGFYQTACICEKFGITPEEYLNNPAKYALDYIQKSIKEKGFDAANKASGKNGFLYSYNSLFLKGSRFNQGDRVEKDIGMSNPVMIIQRTMDGYLLQEKNPEVRTNLERYKILLLEQVENMVDIENNRERCLFILNKQKNKPANKEVIDQLNDGLKIAFLEGGNIEKWHLPIEYTDSDGRVLPKPSYKDVLARKDMYSSIVASYKQNVKDLEDIQNANDQLDLSLSSDPPLKEQCKLIEESMFDYLMAHPEDSRKPEYKELEKAAMEAHKKFGIDSPKVSPFATKYNEWKKDFTVEHNTLYTKAKERDLEVNKDIERFRKSNNETAINEVIVNRMKELARDFRLHKITENYFTNRVESLLKIKNDPNAKIEKPPKFFDESNPDLLRSDMEIINSRVRNKESENYLDSFESFKKKIIKDKVDAKMMELDEVDEISDDHWKALYESELISSGIADRPLPAGYKEQEKELEYGDREYRGIVNEFDLNANGEVEKIHKQTKRVTYARRKAELKEALMTGEGNLSGMIAKTVGAEVYERLKGKLPGGVDEEVFSRRIGNNPIFKKVVEPLLDSLNSKANQNIRGKVVDSIIKMVDDKKIVNACDKEQKKENGVKYIKDEFQKEMQNLTKQPIGVRK